MCIKVRKLLFKRIEKTSKNPAKCNGHVKLNAWILDQWGIYTKLVTKSYKHQRLADSAGCERRCPVFQQETPPI